MRPKASTRGRAARGPWRRPGPEQEASYRGGGARSLVLLGGGPGLPGLPAGHKDWPLHQAPARGPRGCEWQSLRFHVSLRGAVRASIPRQRPRGPHRVAAEATRHTPRTLPTLSLTTSREAVGVQKVEETGLKFLSNSNYFIFQGCWGGGGGRPGRVLQPRAGLVDGECQANHH